MSPDETRAMVAKSLSASHPGKDVRVEIGPVPWGNWIWDDRHGCHVPLTSSEIFRALGFSFNLQTWIRSLPKVGINDERHPVAP